MSYVLKKTRACYVSCREHSKDNPILFNNIQDDADTDKSTTPYTYTIPDKEVN